VAGVALTVVDGTAEDGLILWVGPGDLVTDGVEVPQAVKKETSNIPIMINKKAFFTSILLIIIFYFSLKIFVLKKLSKSIKFLIICPSY
jgi:hypothetical protein